jgi:hypothetical protein
MEKGRKRLRQRHGSVVHIAGHTTFIPVYPDAFNIPEMQGQPPSISLLHN